MSKPANKTMIGAFVVVAVVLAVAALVLFGSGKFFRKTETWLTFFQGSVRGLNVGSPVLFRGVQIGQVTDIIVGFDAAKLKVFPNLQQIDFNSRKSQKSEKELHSALIKEGLRAQLQMQSLVTGQLLIDVDFYPDTPAKLIGIDQFKDNAIFEESWEIPSIPTPLQELEKALNKINIKEIAKDLRQAMNGIAKLANDPDLYEGISVIKNTLTDIQKLARNLDSKIEPLATSFDQTLVEARAGIGDARKLITNIDKKTTPLISKIQNATNSAQMALEQANQTLKSLKQIAEEGSQLRFEVSATLREISAASRSVRVLADFIDQHPDALLRGRAVPTGEK